MYCSKCGKQIADGSRFCSFCGAPVAEIPSPVMEPETNDNTALERAEVKFDSEIHVMAPPMIAYLEPKILAPRSISFEIFSFILLTRNFYVKYLWTSKGFQSAQLNLFHSP